MELKLDISKEYAIALEGGGAKGAYEVGVWKALNEAGIKYNAVSGASVGALNGAMMAMRDLDKAVELWENITFSQVMDVDDEIMKRIFDKGFGIADLRNIAKHALSLLKEGGFDVSPLRKLLSEVIDEEKIMSSDVDFFLVTFSLSDMKELDVDVKTLNSGTLNDMLLASAYLPAFKREKLGGKFYSDGGLQNVVPLDSLVNRGYKDIIVVRIFGFGIEKRVKISKDTTVTTIGPKTKLGYILNFDAEQSKKDIMLGYFDAKRVLYGLYGDTYYIDRTWTEKEAYDILLNLALDYFKKLDKKTSLRELNEEIFRRMAKELGSKGDYYDVFIRYIEKAAQYFKIPYFEIMTDEEIYNRVCDARKNKGKKHMPKSLRFLPDE